MKLTLCWMGIWPLLMVTACDGDDRAPPADVEVDGMRSPRPLGATDSRGSGDAGAGQGDMPGLSSGNDGGAGSGGSGGAGQASNGEPMVSMLTPTDARSPDEVYDEELLVRCRFEPAEGSELDTSTVFFELVNDDEEVLQSLPGARGDEPNVYEVTFPVQNLDSGPVHARCGVSDSSAESKLGATRATTFIDHGPVVAIITPADGAAESALGAVAFEYRIAPDELIDDDAAAAIGPVRLAVLGEQFELIESSDDPGVYRTTIDFADPEVFEEIPSGVVQVAVAATNQREITHTERYTFLLDGTGPTISLETPKDTSIVGGTVTLELEVEDAVSSVDWDTLEVQLNDEVFPYDANGPWDLDEETVRFTFETGQITGSVVQINLNVRVDDVAGNESAGASALFYRDEQPPIVSLDPPNFRIMEADSSPAICSLSFDPLGSSPANGERVWDLARYRALVWDQTNGASGQEVFYLAGTDTSSVDLFVRRAGTPLVIDTTGDGQCDDVDHQGTRFQELTALKATGNVVFREESDGHIAPIVSEETCDFVSRSEPKHLCENQASDLTVVIDQPNYDDERAIYVVSPDNGFECTGRSWELRSAGLSGYQGWVCLAVRALDRVANRGVSEPIAVCLENDQVDGLPSCHEDLSEPAPDCTDGCSDPPGISPGGVILVER